MKSRATVARASGIYISLLAGFHVLCAGASPVRGEEPSAAGPNILILYADQYRFDCLGAAGHPDIRTPNLDRLAGEGVHYRNSFCVWPVCTPSRYSLLSGLYAHQHRGRSNRSTLPLHIRTFPRLLAEAGWRTSAVGKMHFTPAYLDVGFETMTLAEQDGPGRDVDDYHRHLKELGLINALDQTDQERRFRPRAPDEYWETFGAQVSDLPDEHHITTWVADRAAEEIAGWKPGERRLLMVGFLKPHHPFDPPAPWHETYDPAGLKIPDGWTDAVPPADAARSGGYFDNERLTIPALRRVMAYYYATITHMDHHIGRIVEELKRAGVYDETLIVFTADHGEYLGFHHLLLKGNHMYDPLIRVPLIIKYPSGRHAGEVSDDLVNTLDLTATILSEAGVRSPREMQGAPLGGNTPGLAEPREFVVAHDGTQFMVRTLDRKLLTGRRSPEGDMLFDLDRDPAELNSVIDEAEYSGDLARLREMLLRWFMEGAELPPYVDVGAAQIRGENVPSDMNAAGERMREYFDTEVEPFLKPPGEARKGR